MQRTISKQEELAIAGALNTVGGRAVLALTMLDPFELVPKPTFKPLTVEEKNNLAKQALKDILVIWDEFHAGQRPEAESMCNNIKSTNCPARNMLIENGRIPDTPIVKVAKSSKTKTVAEYQEQYSPENFRKALIANLFETIEGKKAFLQTIRDCFMSDIPLTEATKGYTLLMWDNYNQVPEAAAVLNEILENKQWPVYSFLVENGRI